MRFDKMFLMLFVFVLIAFYVVSCERDMNDVVSIEIVDWSFAEAYFVGDDIDLKHVSIRITFDDDDTKSYAFSDFESYIQGNGLDPSGTKLKTDEPGTFFMSINYHNVYIRFEYQVYERETEIIGLTDDLEDAIARASEGDTIFFSSGLFELDQPIVIDRSLDLKSVDPETMTVLLCDGPCFVLDASEDGLNETDSVSFEGFKIVNTDESTPAFDFSGTGVRSFDTLTILSSIIESAYAIDMTEDHDLGFELIIDDVRFDGLNKGGQAIVYGTHTGQMAGGVEITNSTFENYGRQERILLIHSDTLPYFHMEDNTIDAHENTSLSLVTFLPRENWIDTDIDITNNTFTGKVLYGIDFSSSDSIISGEIVIQDNDFELYDGTCLQNHSILELNVDARYNYFGGSAQTHNNESFDISERRMSPRE